MLKVGDTAPPFRGPDQEGREVSLETLLEGGPVVLFFYPKDFTRVCTQEACLFRDSYDELAEQGVSVVGVSVDDEVTHRRFADRHSIDYPLLSDKNREISRAYETLHAFGLFNKRITFVIGTDRIIRGRFHHELNAEKHLRDVRALLTELH